MKVIDLENPKEKIQYPEGTEWNRVTQDYIRQFKGILTDEECKKIIDTNEYNEWDDEWDENPWQIGSFNGSRVCSFKEITNPEIDDLLFGVFGKMLKLYAKDFWRASSYLNDTGYTLTRYHVGDCYPIHHEPSGSGIVATISLSSSEGGDTQFFGREKVDSSIGMGFVYPASFMFPSAVLPVTEGVRYYVSTTFK